VPRLVRRFYPWADRVVAVSRGAADDLVRAGRLKPELVQVVHNPIITPEVREMAAEPLEHPWFESGADPVVFPDGIAQRLPAGSRLVFEVHYATNGSAGQDRTRLALRFANSPPLQEVHARPVSNTDFIIPPGESQYQVRSSVSFDGPVSLIGIVPHAHRRGKTYEYRLLYEDGRAETILSVPRYNWLWESAYRFVEPIAVPRAAKTMAVSAMNSTASGTAAIPCGRKPAMMHTTSTSVPCSSAIVAPPSVRPAMICSRDTGATSVSLRNPNCRSQSRPIPENTDVKRMPMPMTPGPMNWM